MEGAEFSEHVINGVERPIKPAELFSVVLHILAGDSSPVDGRDTSLRTSMQMKGAWLIMAKHSRGKPKSKGRPSSSRPSKSRGKPKHYVGGFQF